MFHAGIALQLSRIVWDDRRAEARAGGRSPLARSGRSFRMRQDRAPAHGGVANRLTLVEDPWWLWRVVEPDTEYLRRRAA